MSKTNKPARKPRKWTVEVLEEMYTHWGLKTSAAIAKQLSSKFGHDFTRGAVLQMAYRHGLSCATAQPYYSMAEAARVIGIPHRTLVWHCRRQGLEVITRGPVHYLPDSTWETVRAFYAPAPVPTVTVAEAARRLCYTRGAIHQAVKRGTITAFRVGGRLRIALSEVERREREMAGTRYIGGAG